MHSTMHNENKNLEKHMALIKIREDPFDIVTRLKEIDYRYFVVYNTLAKRFEVHNLGQPANTFCLTVDGALDCRVIKKVWRTRAENVAKLLDEIALHNEKLEKQKDNAYKDELRTKISESYDYLQHHDDLRDAYTTRFV